MRDALVRSLGLKLRPQDLDPAKVADSILRHWPNLSKAAEELGVLAQSLHWQKQHNPVIAKIVAEADAKGCDALEQVLYNRGVSGEPYTFTDRIAYLRAHRPELYDRVKRVEITGTRTPRAEAEARAKLAEEAIDAEIVEGYRSRKARRAPPHP
jgi:hypothetical protein